MLTVLLHGEILTARVHDLIFLLLAARSVVKTLFFVGVSGVLPIVHAGQGGFKVEHGVARAQAHHHTHKQFHLRE